MNDKLTDERLEGLLREFLATDAAASEPSDALRRRVAEAREAAVAAPARRRPFSLSWRPPRALAAAGVAVAVVAVGVLSATLSGLLPLGRPDCSGVTIEAVTDAVTDVRGYTWHMTGTELRARLAFGDEGITGFDYGTEPLEFSGAYESPDAWRVEVVQGWDPAGEWPTPPSTGLLIDGEHDAYLFVNETAWMRAAGSEHFAPAPEENDIIRSREANQLLGLLVGEPFRILLSGEPYGQTVTWSVESERDGCRMTSSNPYSSTPEATLAVELLVDPTTLLPVSATYALRTPEVPISGPQNQGSPRSDVHLEFTYDYDAPLTVDSPVPAGFVRVDISAARRDAEQLGLEAPLDGTLQQLDAAQLWLVRSGNGSAVLLYQAGELASSQIVPDDVDVHVDLVRTDDADPKTFLVCVVNDARVAGVDVTFTSGETRQMGGFAADPSVISGENLGDIVTWVPLDDAGNEVQVNPPRP